MPHPTTEDAAPPAAPSVAARAERPGPTRLQRTTAILATAGVAAALVGLALLLRPVQSPLQDCGAPLAYLLEGRSDIFADPDDPPAGLTAAQVRESNDRPCRTLVAERAQPSALLVAAGLSVAVVAAIVEVVSRARGWRRRARARAATSVT